MQVATLDVADAVFAGDGAAERHRQAEDLVNGVGQFVFPLMVGKVGLQQIAVNVAITRVAVANDTQTPARADFVNAKNQLGQARARDDRVLLLYTRKWI